MSEEGSGLATKQPLRETARTAGTLKSAYAQGRFQGAEGENDWQAERNSTDGNFYSSQGRQSLKYESPKSKELGKHFRLPIDSS